VVLLRTRDPYCRTCFLAAAQHKVRAALGKHKATRPGERVLVAAGGDHGSTALLHILQQGVNSDAKRLLFLPIVLYVEEGAAYGEEEAVTTERIREMTSRLQQFGFPVHLALLESCNTEGVSASAPAEDLVARCPGPAAALAATFAGLREGTARQELLLHLRRAVLLRAARELGCAKVLTGETGTVLAVELLAGVAGGAGAGLAHRVGWRDGRDGEVALLRPLRELSVKEAALYGHLQGLRAGGGGPAWARGQDPFYSLRSLTEQFLVGLQLSFPATVPTVGRTGDKLSPGGAEGEGCALCQGGLDTGVEAHCSLQATNFSRLMSARGREPGLGDLTATLLEVEEAGPEPEGCGGEKDQAGCCGQGDGACRAGGDRGPSLAQVMEHLCYACRRTLGGAGEAAKLPAGLLREVAVRRRRESVRNEISDFLL
jgi:cytoplasmic tRNA 2-thiolation protein 2